MSPYLCVSVSIVSGHPFPCVCPLSAVCFSASSSSPDTPPPPALGRQLPEALGVSRTWVRFQTPTSSLGDLDQALPFSESFPPSWEREDAPRAGSTLGGRPGANHPSACPAAVSASSECLLSLGCELRWGWGTGGGGGKCSVGSAQRNREPVSPRGVP